jgi:diaminohydroxyphosphoribosylaminopyrimidine deaminase / 5-amino-6-(5-phosphoribosylamino)uracil reductase
MLMHKKIISWQQQANKIKPLLSKNKFWLDKCLSLAKLGRRKNSANPLVGCIIIKNNKIIGWGYHKGSGSDHAEIAALKSCSEDPAGSELYVNLEPCCHFGRTPPCCDAVIKARITRVIFSQQDPNPEVNGRGIKTLSEAGIKVDFIRCDKAKQLNKIFNFHIQNAMPYCIAKWAMSLDGKMVCNKNDSPKLSGDKAWLNTHKLRGEVDAICVGANTVINDNPELTCRINKNKIKHNSPLCVILDSDGRCPLDAKILQKKAINRTCVFASNRVSKSFIETVTDHGHEVIIITENEYGLDLQMVLQHLYQKNIYSVLVEGGRQTINSFLNQKLIQQTQVYLTPKIIAKTEKKQCTGEFQINKLGNDIHLINTII